VVVRYPQPATRSVAPARRLWNHLTSSSAETFIELRDKIEKGQAQIADVKVVDGIIYRRTEHASEDRRADDLVSKLWLPM